MLPFYTVEGEKYQLGSRSVSRRRCLVCTAVSVSLLSAIVLCKVVLFPGTSVYLASPFSRVSSAHIFDPSVYTPTYSEYHEAELRLPQHHWERKQPENNETFFFVAGHLTGLGWGNAWQEHLLNAYLAYVSGRTFVFGNYTWNDDGSIYTRYHGKLIPSQIPYSALIRGPLVGEPLPSNGDVPIAASRDYFEQVCPQKTSLDRNGAHLPSPPSALEIVHNLSAELKAIDDPCVQAGRSSGPIFTHSDIFGVRMSLLELWPSFSTSPIITQFGWSRLVELAFDTNRRLFVPDPTPLDPFLTGTSFTSNAERYTPIQGLIAIHIRRGDYERHCLNLAKQYEDFVSVNTFPDLPDSFTVPPATWHGIVPPALYEHYRHHCYPTIKEIVEKVAQVRATPEGRGVRKLYIMTNGKPPFIKELKEALSKQGGWDLVSSSRDMTLNPEQKHVAQAVDMLVAQRAQVFIGNGFSTVTSGAVMMRLANGFAMNSTRFW
ncbi:hypothetical protein BC628DRAFT_1315775 [Trametes gibbosa]|nr:hypothetical protein BC628DRAFT_1315775 [Trametes gibbosa]